VAITITATTLGNGLPDAAMATGQEKTTIREVTLSGTYVTGGYAYSPGPDLGVTRVLLLQFPVPFRNGTNMITPVWDRASAKIMFFQSTTGAPNPLIEVANGTTLTSYVGIVQTLGN
jgi:hypothetical protein